MGNNILQQLQKNLLDQQQEKERQRLQRYLRYAIENYDIEVLDELIEAGASIQELEKEISTLSLAIDSYTSDVYKILYKNRKYFSYPKFYLDDYDKLSSNNLPPELQIQINEQTNQLINTLDYLYEYGADINHYNSLFENGKNKSNVFEYAIDSFIISKQLAPIEWILKKKDFDIKKTENAKKMRFFIESKNPESIKGLQLMVDNGATFYEDRFYNELVTSNPLIDCLTICVADNGRQEKFSLLWKNAPEAQKKELIENYDTSSITILNIDLNSEMEKVDIGGENFEGLQKNNFNKGL